MLYFSYRYSPDFRFGNYGRDWGDPVTTTANRPMNLLRLLLLRPFLWTAWRTLLPRKASAIFLMPFLESWHVWGRRHFQWYVRPSFRWLLLADTDYMEWKKAWRIFGNKKSSPAEVPTITIKSVNLWPFAISDRHEAANDLDLSTVTLIF